MDPRIPRPLDPEPPAYARRHVKPLADVPPGVFDLISQPLDIYVRAMRSQFPEDWRTEQEVWARRGAYMGFCFSVQCPEGEPGFTPVDDVEEISEEEFRKRVIALGGDPDATTP